MNEKRTLKKYSTPVRYQLVELPLRHHCKNIQTFGSLFHCNNAR